MSRANAGCRIPSGPIVNRAEGEIPMPKFVLLLHDIGRFDNLSPDQMQAVIQRYVAWRAKVQQGGRSVMGHKLHDGEGRVMRGPGASMKVTDGPYAEAREVIGGLF